MTLSAAAKVELIEAALADGKYRTLQKQLRYLKNTQQITIQGYLSDSHEALKAEAKRIILELKPISETQDETTPTLERKVKKVLASLPVGTITNNSDFGDRINTGTADEKNWLVNKDKDGAGVTFVKTECGQYYESYAGDAIRSIALLKMPIFVEAGVLRTLVAVPDAVRLQEDAQKLGLTLYLYDRTSDTKTPQDATATEAELPPEFFNFNWLDNNFDSYNKPYPDQREYKPYPKIDQLITETKMAGRYGLTALLHPSNHPTADLNELINGGYGLRVACDLYDIGKGFRSPYLFHESQLHRILR